MKKNYSNAKTKVDCPRFKPIPANERLGAVVQALDGKKIRGTNIEMKSI